MPQSNRKIHSEQMGNAGTQSSRGSDELQDLSGTLFRVRRTLLEQFSRIERDLETRFKERSERFASKDELHMVIEKMHEFRSELDTVLLNVEEKLQTTADTVLQMAQQSVRSTVGGANVESQAGTPPGQGAARWGAAPEPDKSQEPEDPFFSGLNPFNLRRKYHEFSLQLRSEEVDAFGYDPIFERFVRPVFEFLYKKYWRVETYGVTNVPRTGPALLVSNHSGGLPYDATMLKMGILKEHPNHRDVRFMVEDFLFHFPFLGSLMNRFGGVRASQENAQRLLENNLPLVVFPEGVKGLGKLYRDKYHLSRFGRGGFVKLCLRTGAPLVPVAIIGSEEIHPMLLRETRLAGLLGLPYIPITPTFPFFGPLGMIPLPSKWSIHILPPIDFSNYGPGAEKDRVLVYKMSQKVKNQIQETIVDKLKHRRSIWFG